MVREIHGNDSGEWGETGRRRHCSRAPVWKCIENLYGKLVHVLCIYKRRTDIIVHAWNAFTSCSIILWASFSRPVGRRKEVRYRVRVHKVGDHQMWLKLACRLLSFWFWKKLATAVVFMLQHVDIPGIVKVLDAHNLTVANTDPRILPTWPSGNGYTEKEWSTRTTEKKGSFHVLQREKVAALCIPCYRTSSGYQEWSRSWMVSICCRRQCPLALCW